MNNLLEAIFYAFEKATEFEGQKIEILLETGMHHITFSMLNNFVSNQTEKFDVDFVNPLFDLVIKPLDCSNSQFVSLACQKDGDEVIINNKVGSTFQI